MTRWGVAIVVGCLVGIVLVVAYVVGSPRYVVPPGVVPPLSPEEVWGK